PFEAHFCDARQASAPGFAATVRGLIADDPQAVPGRVAAGRLYYASRRTRNQRGSNAAGTRLDGLPEVIRGAIFHARPRRRSRLPLVAAAAVAPTMQTPHSFRRRAADGVLRLS